MTYDPRGNITTLRRNGKALDDSGCLVQGEIDELAYTYIAGTNKIEDVNDVASNGSNNSFLKPSGYTGYDITTVGEDYRYDLNGNMIYDPSKKLTIHYNYLNLPERFEFEDCRVMNITYDAAGSKLKQVFSNGQRELTSKVYVGGIEYNNGFLEAIYHAEGRTYFENGTSRQEFNLSDHLGNSRLTYSDLDGNGRIDMTTDPETNEVLNEQNYYPFGMEMAGNWLEDKGRASNYRFNGKEFSEELGLYDYGARWYDPAIGRWNAVDPKADLQESITPYAYCLNSPILYIDPDGSLPILINGRTGADSQRANDSYWAQNLLNTIANSGIPNPGGQIHYTDGNVGLNYKMNSRGKKIGDPFVSNAAMTASQRTGAGRVVAGQEFESILAKLERDPESGLITEKIQIYSHSRGGAFAQGFTERLLELIEQNSDEFADPNSVIDFGLHLAPHQSNEITGAAGVNNYSISHTLDGLSGNDMANSVNFHTNVGNLKSAHTNTTFGNEVGMFLQSIQANGGDRDGTVRDFFQRVQAAGINITIQ
jgi:RHS repeat-associated protein